MDYQNLINALSRAACQLGVLPELAALRPQFQIHLYDELSSTNQTAWQLVEQGKGAGTVVIARQQRAGKGQWGRTWISPPGGLYLSLVLAPALPLAQAQLLTLTSAWGIATSLKNLGVSIQIKWPNDLVSQGRKVGGILTESRMIEQSETGAHLQWVIIGVGLNWDNPLPQNACSVRQLLPDGSIASVNTLEDLAAIVLRGIWQGFHYWQQQGDQRFIDAYQQKLACRGKKISVSGHPAVVEGVSINGDLLVNLSRDGGNLIRLLKPGEIRLGYNG
ncbi:MAG: biotin--[acetyl-CoA-carboxylase] ligase [Cyanobacteria bacterium P01_C01_bin.120]